MVFVHMVRGFLSCRPISSLSTCPSFPLALAGGNKTYRFIPSICRTGLLLGGDVFSTGHVWKSRCRVRFNPRLRETTGYTTRTAPTHDTVNLIDLDDCVRCMMAPRPGNERDGWAERCFMMDSGMVRTWSVLVPSVYPVLTYV